MTRLLPLLLLSACTAQADPELQISEIHAVEAFVALNCQTDEAMCSKQCGDQFASNDLDIDTTLHFEACLKAAAEKFRGGEA